MLINALRKEVKNLLYDNNYSTLSKYNVGNMLKPKPPTPSFIPLVYTIDSYGTSIAVLNQFFQTSYIHTLYITLNINKDDVNVKIVESSSDTIKYNNNHNNGSFVVSFESQIPLINGQNYLLSITLTKLDEILTFNHNVVVYKDTPVFQNYDSPIDTLYKDSYLGSFIASNAVFNDIIDGSLNVLPSPSSIDTSTIGSTIMTYTARNKANLSATVSRTYNVIANVLSISSINISGRNLQFTFNLNDWILQFIYKQNIQGIYEALSGISYTTSSVPLTITESNYSTTYYYRFVFKNSINNHGFLYINSSQTTDPPPPPVITFSDSWISGNTQIVKDNAYTLPTVSAVDRDGASVSVVVNDNGKPYNNTVVDTYTYNYSATDAYGINTSKTRIYNVIVGYPPTFMYEGHYIGTNSKTIDFTLTSISESCYVRILKDGVQVLYDTSVNYVDTTIVRYTSPNYGTFNFSISVVSVANGVESATQTTSITINDTVPPQLQSFSDGWVPTDGDTYVEINNGYPLPTAIFSDDSGNPVSVDVGSYGDAYDNTKLGSYYYYWNGTDTSLNQNTIYRTFVVEDTIQPIIIINGTNYYNGNTDLINLDYQGTLPIINVYDNSLESITASASPTLDINSATTQTITYTASDSSGNTTNITITYNVISQGLTGLTLSNPSAANIKMKFNVYGTYHSFAYALDLSGTFTLIDPSQLVANADGSFEYQFDAVYYRTFNVEAMAVNAAGNQIGFKYNQNITLPDTAKPVININGTDYNHGATATIDLIQNGTLPTISVSDNSGQSITASPSATLDISSATTQIITYTASDSSGNTTNITITYNVVYHGLTGITLTNTTLKNIRIDFVGTGTYNHIHYNVNSGTDVMLTSGVNYVVFDAGDYGIFNIAAKAVDSGHILIGNIITNSITIIEPSGTIGTPAITNLNFTVEITGITKSNITVDLLDASDAVLVSSGDLGSATSHTITHTEGTAGTYNYKVRFTDAQLNVKLVALDGVNLTASDPYTYVGIYGIPSVFGIFTELELNLSDGTKINHTNIANYTFSAHFTIAGYTKFGFTNTTYNSDTITSNAYYVNFPFTLFNSLTAWNNDAPAFGSNGAKVYFYLKFTGHLNVIGGTYTTYWDSGYMFNEGALYTSIIDPTTHSDSSLITDWTYVATMTKRTA